MDAMLLEGYRDPREVYIALRTDGLKGSGTIDDPFDGGVREGAASLNNLLLNRKTFLVLTGGAQHHYVPGQTTIQIAGDTFGNFNGSFRLWRVNIRFWLLKGRRFSFWSLRFQDFCFRSFIICCFGLGCFCFWGIHFRHINLRNVNLKLFRFWNWSHINLRSVSLGWLHLWWLCLHVSLCGGNNHFSFGWICLRSFCFGRVRFDLYLWYCWNRGCNCFGLWKFDFRNISFGCFWINRCNLWCLLNSRDLNDSRIDMENEWLDIHSSAIGSRLIFRLT